MRHVKRFIKKLPNKYTIELINKPYTKNPKMNISFVTGSLLIMSETLPFVKETDNGIIQTLWRLQKEYKSDL